MFFYLFGMGTFIIGSFTIITICIAILIRRLKDNSGGKESECTKANSDRT